MVRSIIVEDDHSHSTQLQNFLTKLGSPIEVIAVATSVEGAVEAINKYIPQLIFLDIELEKGQTGFDLLNLIKKTDFDIIFTTSHIDNNIQEIRLCAIEYIIKPYMYTEVKEVLEKYYSDHKNGLRKERLNSLRTNLMSTDTDHKSIWIPNKSTYIQVFLYQILYCEADNEYTHFHILDINGKTRTLLSSTGLGKWEEELSGYNFCRVSRKHMVNIKYVLQLQKSDYSITLTSGEVIYASLTGREALLKIMKR